MISPSDIRSPALLAGRKIIQTCWVVPALEPAIAQWRNAFGIGPWLLVDNEGTRNRRYRGRPSDVRYTAALAQAGDLQIELIEQTSPGPSCFRDIVAEGALGLHHLAFIAEDYDAECARMRRAGFETAFEAEFGDVRFTYIDTSPALGCMIEIFEDKPMLRDLLALGRSLSEGWDGVTKPIRTMADVTGQNGL